jgi:glycosyltransferase involved in cell wall biosynthesis
MELPLMSGPSVDPLVSIIIPTYNCQAYIAQTLASVLGQSYRSIEVIVVDDGSSDDTQRIVLEHGGCVRLIQQSNQGVCVARNFGLSHAKGDFICFLDHDDYWFDWKLARQIEAFRAHRDAAVVFTDFERWYSVNQVFPAPSSMERKVSDAPSVDPDYSGYIYHQFLIDCWALTSTAMIRREVFEAVGDFDATLPYSEDWDLWLRISNKYPFVKLARASTLYRQHQNQGSRQLREIDYRTRLLESARKNWGLASADGRSVSVNTYKHNLARYHMQFALHQLRFGRRWPAFRSLYLAWQNHPTRLMYAAQMGASLLGWKPTTPVRV